MPLPRRAPELAALDLFVTVVQVGSLSRAAALHRISQPSASARIRSLERRLGVSLLERTPSGSIPTPEGSLVAEWGIEVLEQAERLVAGVEALRARQGGRLRIAASYTVAEYLLPRWLAQLRARRPDMSPELQVANSDQVVALVLSGRADLGFVETPEPPPGLAHRAVADDDLVLVVHPDHPWSRRRRPVEARTLARTPLIVREHGSGTRQALDAAMRTAGLTPVPPLLELGSTAAVKAAIEGGIAPAVLSRLAVGGDVEDGNLRVVPVRGLDLHRRLRAAWAPNRPQPQAAVALLRLAVRDAERTAPTEPTTGTASAYSSPR